MILVRENTLPSFDVARPFAERSSKDIYKDRNAWQHMPQLVANQLAELRSGSYSWRHCQTEASSKLPSPYIKSVYNISKRYDDGSMILLNTASEAVLILDQDEADAFESLPEHIERSSELIDSLVSLGVLVRADEDERFKFKVFRNRYAYADDECVNVTIYPTQDCNARCFYCFEGGEERITMSEDTADEVVEYLRNAISEEDEVIFRWFGGEPLMAADVIDRILCGIDDAFEGKLTYHSIIITDASYIDDRMIEKFVGRWHVRKVQTTLDGYREEHNRRKAYALNPHGSYDQVIRTIGKLLDAGIFTICRFNLDKNNIDDFPKVLDDLEQYMSDSRFYVHATTIRSNSSCDFTSTKDNILPSDYPWFYKKVLGELISRGFYKDPINVLPLRARNICLACSSSSYVINSEGRFYRCLQHSLGDDEATGSIYEGMRLNAAYAKWFNMTDNLPTGCESCIWLPCCQGGCKHYRMQGRPDALPCLREKFYIDVLLDIVWSQVTQCASRS